ncbi:MAG TPA: TetR family transcriptional regulator [Solirubrobacteraceae bacterium]|jgi:AcrR family transcriptional regulator
MGRWQPNARGRLEKAAMELYAERGFDQTPVAEIAERAGLTERTFFRHFADKREVLFAGSAQLQDLLVEIVAGTPASVKPIDAVAAGIDAIGAALQESRGRAFARQRQSIVAASAELRERELNKLSSLAGALADTLRERDVDDPAASLLAEIGIAVFRISFERWVSAPRDQDLRVLMRESLDEVRSLAADGARVGAARSEPVGHAA